MPAEIDVQALKQMIDQKAEFCLLDCREQAEYDTANINGSTLIPMSEIQQRLKELETKQDQLIVVYCHLGGRSMQVATYLEQNGFSNTQSLAGGIDAWSTTIDPTVRRY